MLQVGLGEGFAPSAATAVLAKQVPQSERARAVSAVFGGLDVGSAVGLLLCGPLIRMYGWPSVFYAFGVFGVIWCILWPYVRPEIIDPMTVASSAAAEEAEESKKKAAASASGKTYTPPAPVDPRNMPWKAFMSSRAVWAIITVRHRRGPH